MLLPVELTLFEEVGEALRGLVPRELGELRHRAHRWGIKVWFGPAKPTREHYEAQVIRADHVEDASALALEIGFHAEHPSVQDNDAVVSRLVATEKEWRPVVGDECVVGPFLGRPDVWRRASETWADPDLGEDDLAMEVAARLTDYITAIEPVRRAAGAASPAEAAAGRQ
jgi:hypothetical protein